MILEAIMLLLSAVILIAMMIPGEQPEKTLQAIVDFIKKFSKKPVEEKK
jgi:hemerythrin-like domain-containing protein